METFKSFTPQIYNQNEESFEGIALEVFQYQAQHNPLYREYINLLKIDVHAVNSLSQIPFLPISFFKTNLIRTGDWVEQEVFESSGTTMSVRSRHLVRDLQFYRTHSRRCFEQFFGRVQNYHILALLPSYLERRGSSLISMIEWFISESKSTESGFYLREYDDLFRRIERLKGSDRKIILWGVSFALLDLAEQFSVDLSDCYLFETGGMKGRRQEITRQELHSILKSRFNDPPVFSEYGMTELFSQAYTSGGYLFHPPRSMRVVGRDPADPFQKGLTAETAALNVVDLANWHTISFIETEDLGKVYEDGSFEVLGRMDNSEIRGCNLLI